MQYFNIDYLIVYAFLAVSLYIGLRAGRGVKDIRDYVVANRSFGTGALVLTYLATNTTGAGVLHVVDLDYNKGIIFVLAGLGVVISYIITAFFIAPKFARFSNCLTMGDLMNEFYGPLSGIITGILGFLTAISIAGMDLLGISIVCETFLGIKASWSIIAIALLLAIYSARGGIRSVTATDIFQFLVFIVGLPTVAYFILNKAGGIQAVFTNLPVDRLKVVSHENFSFYLTLFIVWSFVPVDMIDPAIMQRLLMGKDSRQLRNKYLVIGGFEPALLLLLLCIAFSALKLYPNLQGQQVLPHIIQNLLPNWLKGIAVTSLLSTSISSISSYLHISGVTFVHDIIQPLTKKRYAINELLWMRYATLVISFIAAAIALKTTNTFDLLLTTLAFTGPWLMFPLLSGTMGLKTDKLSFYVSLLITLAAFVVCKFFLPGKLSYLTTLITTIANGIAFFGIHLYIHRGFAIVYRTQGKATVWNPNRKSIFQILNYFIFTPKTIIRYSQEKVKAYGAPYLLFGVFFAINFIVPYFTWPVELLPYNDFIVLLRMIGSILCGLLIVKGKWNKSLLSYLPTFWHLTVMYCLPFMSTIMLLFTGASIEWVVHIIAIIILLFLLLDWVTAIIIGLLGIVLGYFTYRFMFGIPVISISFISKYLMVYQGVFGILIGLLFARRRQFSFDQLAIDNKILTDAEKEIKQEYFETFLEKIRLVKILKNADIQKLSTAVKELRSTKDQIKDTTLPVESLYKNLQNIESSVASVALALTRVDQMGLDYLRLEVKTITIEQLLLELKHHFPNYTLNYINRSQQQKIICDPMQLIKMLKNTIVALFNNNNNDDSQQKDYYLTIDDAQLIYALPQVGTEGDRDKHIKGIRLLISQTLDQLPDMPNTYTPDMSGSVLPNPKSEQEFLLTMNQRIIKAHYGYTNVDVSNHTNYADYLYVIPVDVTEIRPSNMNSPDMEFGIELKRADDSYPGAKEKEEAFLKAVQQKSAADIDQVKRALEIIKQYHGSVVRKSGEPYYLHPLAVAQIVLDWNQEEATILGALLHDTVEDTPMLLENIDMLYGTEVATIVDYVTHFVNLKNSFYMVKLTDFDNKSMLLQATDRRALYIKVADRLHNMRTIEGHKTEEKRKAIAQDTLNFFVPLAMFLNLEQAAQELLYISNKVLNAKSQ